MKEKLSHWQTNFQRVGKGMSLLKINWKAENTGTKQLLENWNFNKY